MKLIHKQEQFLSFLDTYSTRKLYFSENSLCDVMSHRVIFAYETKLNILKKEQVTKIL
jgi:hypothetical protein